MTRRTLSTGVAALLGSPASAAGERVQLPFRLTHNVPWTVGTLNGQRAGPLLISTGHAWVTFDHQVMLASRAVKGRSYWADTALGRRECAFYATDEIVLGGRLRLNDFQVASLPEGSADPDFQGSIGGIFGRRPALFDFEANVLSVGERGQFKTDGFHRLRSLGGSPVGRSDPIAFGTYGASVGDGVEWNPLFDRRPIVEAGLGGRTLRLLLDTGFPGAVLLYGEGGGDSAPDGQAWLFAEGPASKIERAAYLDLGGLRLRAPTVEHVRDGVQPHHSTKEIDGVVGMEVLRRLRLFLNLAREEVMVAPAGGIDEAFSYNRSGMSLTKVGREIVIARITPQAPAWRAGLRPGDKLVNWDGAPSLRALSRSFSGPPGAEVVVIARRDDRTAEIRLVMEELV